MNEHALDERTRAALRSILGAAPLDVTAMDGATSADLYRIRMDQGDAVLRRFREDRWEASADMLVQRELDILAALADVDLQTPRPLGRLPENGVLMSLLPGRVHLPAEPPGHWLDALAGTLSDIHETTVLVEQTYESWNNATQEDRPDWWSDEALWESAWSRLRQPPSWTPGFIHRDYHPVNVLWEADRISGIVDWINACMGPAGVDVAHCRLNLALMYGQSAADRFLAGYKRAMPGYQHEPYWDLDDAFSALPEVTPYAPWESFGLHGLSTGLVRERLLVFVAAAVNHPGTA